MSNDAPTLCAWHSPIAVNTGTPIHSDSHVVVVPAYGNVSSAMSTMPYMDRCAPVPPTSGNRSMRHDSTPNCSIALRNLR